MMVAAFSQGWNSCDVYVRVGIRACKYWRERKTTIEEGVVTTGVDGGAIAK